MNPSLRASTGLTVYSHQVPSLDILAHARLHTNLNIYGSLHAKVVIVMMIIMMMMTIMTMMMMRRRLRMMMIVMKDTGNVSLRLLLDNERKQSKIDMLPIGMFNIVKGIHFILLGYVIN